MGSRSYRSRRRTEAAAATRGAILAAAEELFVSRGYSCVTVAQIADAAQVAVQTVYASAGGKADMLRELLLPAVNDPHVEITQRAIAATDNPREVIDITARGAREAHEVHWSTLAAVIPQCPSEPAAAAALDAASAEYVKALGAIVERLDQLGALHADLNQRRAVDLLWFHLGQDAWFSLVAHRRWSFDDAEEWLTAAAKRALLKDPGD
ncbi:TetR/AcrR family transcriptional regulator [Streptomyces sp. NPDC093064]|uniref:TetR/AcrR family transcriptional regulator n=1 Tax=Streptomyces sp. NPDC093064 TaxID=3366020 RepID=UPI00380B1867